MLRRLASLVSRIVLGLAALAFLLGALLFLLGLQLALVPMRIRQHAQARLVLDIAANIAELVALQRDRATAEQPPDDGAEESARVGVVGTP